MALVERGACETIANFDEEPAIAKETEANSLYKDNIRLSSEWSSGGLKQVKQEVVYDGKEAKVLYDEICDCLQIYCYLTNLYKKDNKHLYLSEATHFFYDLYVMMTDLFALKVIRLFDEEVICGQLNFSFKRLLGCCLYIMSDVDAENIKAWKKESRSNTNILLTYKEKTKKWCIYGRNNDGKILKDQDISSNSGLGRMLNGKDVSQAKKLMEKVLLDSATLYLGTTRLLSSIQDENKKEKLRKMLDKLSPEIEKIKTYRNKKLAHLGYNEATANQNMTDMQELKNEAWYCLEALKEMYEVLTNKEIDWDPDSCAFFPAYAAVHTLLFYGTYLWRNRDNLDCAKV